MPSFWKSLGNFFTGTPAKRENVSNLRPEQEGLYNQLVGAGQGPGAGGAFGQSADYYRGLLGDESPDFDAFAAPAMRQYSQDIVPQLSEQFAGMGSGGLSSSGFRNAQIQGATDLSERLGALRAQLRQTGAQNLQNVGQMGLGNFSQNMETRPGSSGFLANVAPTVGQAAGMYFGGPLGGLIGQGFGNAASQAMGGVPGSGTGGSNVGANRSPYQAWNIPASPQMGGY